MHRELNKISRLCPYGTERNQNEESPQCGTFKKEVLEY